MGRNTIVPISEERIRQLETLPADANPRLRTQDIAYILGLTRKSLRAMARERQSFRKIVKRFTPKGEIFVFYQDLMRWIDGEHSKIEARRMAL